MADERQKGLLERSGLHIPEGVGEEIKKNADAAKAILDGIVIAAKEEED